MTTKTSSWRLVLNIIIEIVIGIAFSQLAHVNRFILKIKNDKLRYNLKLAWMIFVTILFPTVAIALHMP